MKSKINNTALYRGVAKPARRVSSVRPLPWWTRL